MITKDMILEAARFTTVINAKKQKVSEIAAWAKKSGYKSSVTASGTVINITTTSVDALDKLTKDVEAKFEVTTKKV